VTGAEIGAGARGAEGIGTLLEGTAASSRSEGHSRENVASEFAYVDFAKEDGADAGRVDVALAGSGCGAVVLTYDSAGFAAVGRGEASIYAGIAAELTGGASFCEDTELTGATLAADDGFAAEDGAADSGEELGTAGGRGGIILAVVSADFDSTVSVGFKEIVFTDSKLAISFGFAVGRTGF
jgi:hypothetical protein